ncbi:DUF1266 domain-containing protein [Streptomyces lavendulocolor]|uniref:DUF1266 domain-containing protein n=1 Tax=Streptomyces lavendulocolor TaxID=67316 RepID=UPI0031DB9BFA
MSWVPPTHIERQLYEAALRGDVQAQLRVLAGAELFIGQARHEVDAEPDTVRWRVAVDPASRGTYRPLFTGTVCGDYTSERRTLRRSWDITDHDGWRRQTAFLLDYSNSPAEPEYALRVREQLRKSIGELPPADLWRETAAGSLQDRGAPPALVAEMAELVRRILRYEARFRADGLLAEDGWVTTASAYDYGRAVNLARWGLSARYCDPQQAEQTIVHAGALAKAAYSSWEGFSAGYALGRVLRFDGEEYGHFYEGVLAAHRLLTDDEGSPWRNIPWR